MNKLTKKQVKAVLDLTNPHKDGMEGRPTLWCMALKDSKAYATNGYVLVEYELGEDTKEDYKMIKRESIDRWYRLASARDLLDLSELNGEGDIIDYGKYPDVKRVLDDYEQEKAEEAYTSNDYIKLGCDLIGDNMTIKGVKRGVIMEGENVKVLAMGLRKQ